MIPDYNTDQNTSFLDPEGLETPLRVITLNRPDKLNAFTEEMHIAFRAALEAARDDDACRAVLLTGAGRGFCAGQDLGDAQPLTPDSKPSRHLPNSRLTTAAIISSSCL